MTYNFISLLPVDLCVVQIKFSYFLSTHSTIVRLLNGSVELILLYLSYIVSCEDLLYLCRLIIQFLKTSIKH